MSSMVLSYEFNLQKLVFKLRREQKSPQGDI